MLQDVRYGLRALGKAPGTTIAAVLSLALGIGVNTAIFSILDLVLLRMLPVKSPEALVILAEARKTGQNWNFSYPTYEEFRNQKRVFSDVVAHFPIVLTQTFRDKTERVPGELVSGNYFDVLGVPAFLGRVFTSDDDRTAAAHPAVLSYGYWQRRFGADPAILGKTIYLNRLPFVVIGITPRAFTGMQPGIVPDIRVPLMMQAQLMPGSDLLHTHMVNWLVLVARLKPRVSMSEAQVAMDALYPQIRRAEMQNSGQDPSGVGRELLENRLQVLPGSQGLPLIRRQWKKPLLLLMGLVAIMLLIACGNVANLVLAKTSRRRNEIAVRLALGASRVRLVRQLLTESAPLALLSGAVGVVFGVWGGNLVLTLSAQHGRPIALEVRPDLRVLAFTVAVSLITAILFGLVPALAATRRSLLPALKDQAATGSLRLGPSKALIVGQVALTLPMLFGAGLFVRTIRNLDNMDLGFQRQNLVLLSVDPASNGYAPAQIKAFYDRLLDRVRTLPGVRAASLALVNPVAGGGMRRAFSVQGYQPRPGEDMQLNQNTVAPGYFETLGIPFLFGRDFGPQDNEGAPKVAVINDQSARYFFQNENPIGRRLNVTPKNPAGIEIIGVVRNAKYRALREDTWRTVYLPLAQEPQGGMTVHVRAGTTGDKIIAAITHEVQSLDKALPIFNVRTMEQQIDGSLLQERLLVTVSVFFGVLALILAAVGLYGVISYSVAWRTREIAIRMALGAQSTQVFKLFFRDTLLLVAPGITVGIPLARALGAFARTLLYGIGPNDPMTALLATFVLGSVALCASHFPARRAAKVDPAVTLRYE